MSSPPDRPSARPTGPPPKETDKAGERVTLVEETEKVADAALRSAALDAERTPEPAGARETKPPTRRETMEVQAAWLQTQAEDSPPSSTPYGGSAEEAARAMRLRKPPRVPGAMRTLPPLPVGRTKPPPPVPAKSPIPRHLTTNVEMSWVELVDDDLEEDTDAAELEGPPEPRFDAATVEVAVPAIIPPNAAPAGIEPVATAPIMTTEDEAVSARVAAASIAPADAEKLRLEALAARQREQDARDRELRQRRKAERERERLEQEARQARREQEQRDEDTAALSEIGPRSQPRLDLSNIDDEIDSALDKVLGPNLSYPPPPPDEEDDAKK